MEEKGWGIKKGLESLTEGGGGAVRVCDWEGGQKGMEAGD